MPPKRKTPASLSAAPDPSQDAERELLELTQRLLDAIRLCDADTYAAHCAPELTCFEDVSPYRIDGIDFHVSLLTHCAADAAGKAVRVDMLTPHVQIYGDCGIVTYTRLNSYDDQGKPHWTAFNETRVYSRITGPWRMVHFHRSPAGQ